MKKKGFTLIELIITLTLTVIVLGIIYSFTRTSNIILVKTEISSILQEESETIQKYLTSYVMETEALVEINNKVVNSSRDFDYKNILSSEGKIRLEEIKFKNDKYFYEFYCKDRELSIRKLNNEYIEETDNKFPKILSKNIEEMYIRPIDFRVNKEGNLNYSKGIEFSINLKVKKGSVEESLPLSVIIKFRNK